MLMVNLNTAPKKEHRLHFNVQPPTSLIFFFSNSSHKYTPCGIAFVIVKCGPKNCACIYTQWNLDLSYWLSLNRKNNRTFVYVVYVCV